MYKKPLPFCSNQIYCRGICLDISDFGYFYILHIVDEIVAECFDIAAVDAIVDSVVLSAAVVVTMQWDTDVTNSLFQPMDDILSFDNRNLDLMLQQHVNSVED